MFNLRWAFAPFLALVVAVGIACGGGDDDNDSGATSQTTSQSQTAGQTQSGSQTTSQGQTQSGATGASGPIIVDNLAQALENVDSFRFDLKMNLDFDLPQSSTGSEDAAMAAMFMALLGNIEVSGAFQAPDRFQAESTLFGTNVEVIQIGEEAWINDGSGWQVDDGSLSSSLPFDVSSPAELPFDFIPADQLQNAETSSEEVNGVDTTKYHFDKEALVALAEAEGETADLADLSEMDTMELNIWITEEGLPVKMQLNASGESEGADIAINMDFNVRDLNDSGIHIEPPL